MKRTKKQIIDEINSLLQELASSTDQTVISDKKTDSQEKMLTGCVGALQLLQKDGFFDELKNIEEVMLKLKEEGDPYSRELVSMNLLNLVRKKTLRRLKQNNKWHYIVRR